MRYNYYVLLGLFTAGKKNQNENPPTHSRKLSSFAALLLAVLFSVFGISKTAAQTTYYSKAAATDFTAVASWGTALDGTGTSPATISNADDFIIANGAIMNLSANAAVRQLSITLGTLNVAGNTLDVAKATGNDAVFSIASGATLNVTGGNVNVMGQFAMVSGAIFKQSNGTIKVDGNNAGAAAGSIAGNIVVLYGTPTTLQLTGGTLIITDPSYTTSYALYGNCSTATNIGTAHTIQFGDGVSTDAGGANGFYMYLFPGSSYLILGNVIANGGTGTNRFVSTLSTVGILGNLTVNANSEYRIASTSHISGDLINNGTLTTTSTLTFGSFANGIAGVAANAQTVSGSGVFRNLTAAPTANFTNLTINNSSVGGVSFANVNTLLNGTNTGTVSGTLTFTSGVVNTGANTFVLGINGTTLGTLTYTDGGFNSGSTFSRWYGTAGTGVTIAAGSNPAVGTGSYPFVTGVSGSYAANHFHRATATLTAAGQMAVKFNAGVGTTTISTVTESALNFDKKSNTNWVVSTSAGYTSAATYGFVALGQNAYTATSANARLLINEALFGTYSAGSSLPMAQRIAVPVANIIGTYTLGSISAEAPIESAQSGPWENSSTWAGGVVPSCVNAAILAGHTVTVSTSTTATPSNFIINLGGNLTVSGGSLIIGCTNSNNYLSNIGTLTVSGGIVNINGNINNFPSSTFTQSGGVINVDGNNGVVGTSVLTGTPLVWFQSNTVNLTGGTLKIIDGHIGTATADRVLTYVPSAAPYPTVTSGHVVQFGDGISTQANSTKGFEYSLGTRFTFGNIVVNTLASANAFVASSSATAIIHGDLTITAGDFRGASTTQIIGGNIINNGTLTNTGTLTFGQVLLANLSTPTITANPNTQNVSGSGVFRNLTAAPTANFTGITVNNSSVTGATFANANSLLNGTNTGTVSGTLTMTTGLVNTGTNAFVLGISAASTGTLAYTAGGFSSGSTFSRWWGTAIGGAAITAGTTPTATAAGVYPFAIGTSTAFVPRNMYLNQTVAATTGGKINVKYNEVAGTSPVSIVDGAYTVDTRSNGNWAVTQSGITGAATYTMAINALNIYNANNGNSRITLAAAPSSGTHQNGTNYPNAQRITMPLSNLVDTYFIGIAAADIPFTSVVSGDWNTASTWNKGTVPTCTDIIVVASPNNVMINSVGNVSKNVTIASGGTLTIASGDLTVGCTLNNNFLTNNGTLTVSGGLLSINGNLMNNAGSVFNQSAGNIVVDGSDGTTPNSVLTGTPLVRVTANAPANLNWTGGTLTIVDPHYGASTSDYALSISQGGAANAANPNHTVKFGNGLSTTSGGHANGFYMYLFPGSFYYSLGNVTVDALTATNRLVKGTSIIGILGNLTVTSGEYQIASSNIIAGNVVNNGTITATSLMAMGTFVPTASISASANAQSISGTGVFQNLSAASTANLTNFQVFNSNVSGVTLNVPLSVSGSLTLNSGIINTSNANLLTLGTTAAAGTLTGGSSTAYINGPFARTIVNANANTNYIHFPVGKSVYAPIWLAPATTAISKMKAETFDTNTGTVDASLINLATTRRWEAPLVSGTLTDINVRVGDAGVVNTSIPVQAPSASGIYTNTFGSVATYAAGTPPTTQSNTVATSANYTGFLSYANSNSCSGTPAPGNTIASANNICLGTSVTLSLQNITSGSGVTYAWESSTDGVLYTPISGATNPTFVTTPTGAAYYRAKVTCSGNTGTSTPVQITFTNQITGTTPGSVCGQGTVNLAASGNSGTTVRWYDAATNGNLVGTGSPFTTPSLTATTNYYAAAGSTFVGIATLGAGGTSSTTVGQSFFPGSWGGTKTQYIIKASELYAAGLTAGPLTSLGFEPTTSGQTYQGFSVNLGLTTNLTAPATTFITTGLSQVYAGTEADNGYTPIANSINTLTFGTGIGSTPTFVWDGTSSVVVSISWSRVPSASTSTASSMKVDDVGFVSAAYRQRDSVTPAAMLAETSVSATSTFRPKFLINGQLVCSSPRVAVVATVTTPPTFTLSGNPAVICAGQSSAAVTVTAGSSDYDTYVWSPATGVSGNASTGWIFNPTSTTTYTLTASQSSGSLCSTTATVVVTVNALPNVITISPSPAIVCVDTVQALTASVASSVVNLGLGSTTNTTTAYPAPYSNYYGGTKHQMLIRASELTGLGIAPGATISKIAFNVTAVGTTFTGTLNNFQIDMKNTTSNVLTSTSFESGLTNVLAATSVAIPTTGLPASVTHTLTTPFVWNGTDNLVIQTSYSNANAGTSTDYVQMTNSDPGFVSTNWYRADSATSAAILAAATPTSSGNSRPNMIITASVPGTSLVWSPITNLYTDATALTPYLGTSATTVYFKSSTAGGPTTYTVTGTGSNSCSRTATVDVTVNATSAPTGSTAQTFCNAATVANLVATGTGIQWYAAAIGGTALASTNALVDGAHYYASQTVSGCESATRLDVTVTINVTAAPTGSTAQIFCNAATVANLVATGTAIQWYAAAIGGTALASTDALVDGAHYYASQTVSGCESATRLDVTVTINVTATPTGSTAQTFCNAATVANLAATGTAVQWYAAAIGGTALASTDALVDGAHYFASQTVSGCESATRLDVTVTINVTAVPTGPATQTFCNAATVANLAATGTGIQWYAAATGGTALVSTTTLVNGAHYFASQTISGCESTTRLDVTVNVNNTPAPTGSATQTFCNSATVANLSATGTGIQWYAAATGGTALVSTTALVNGVHYFASQTISGCESATRLDVTVTLNNTPAPTGAATQTFVTGQMISDIVVSGNNVVWYASAANAASATSPLPNATLLVNNTTYYATQTVSGCTSTSSLAVTVTVTLKVDSFDSNSFSFYPNPVIDILNLSYSQEITNVKVFNLIGQQVLTKNINATTAQIDMSGFANGAYFIKVSSDKATKTIKVIKK